MQEAIKSFEDTIKVNENKINQELEDLFIKIHTAIKNGLFYVFGQGTLNDFTVHQLEKLGYVVNKHIYNGINYYFISWFACDVLNDISSSNNDIQNNSTNNSNDNTRYKANKHKFQIFWR